MSRVFRGGRSTVLRQIDADTAAPVREAGHSKRMLRGVCIREWLVSLRCLEH